MVSSVIAKTNGRDKVIDFRDGLVAANMEDYAMLHGAGGSHHAPCSVIKLYICDYTAGTGSMSRTVSANISPELCEQIFEVCKRNIGTCIVPGNLDFIMEQWAVSRKLVAAAEMFYGVVSDVTSILKRVVATTQVTGMPDPAKVVHAMYGKMEKTKARASGDAKTPVLQPFYPIDQKMDFTYTQDRVHNFASKTGGTDIAPVQRLQIWHNTYRKQGDLSNYPWTVKIINGKARVNVKANGATIFDAHSMTEIEEAYIQIADADMFRMMSRVCHYIMVWENVVASKVVADGLKMREQERQSYMSQRQADTIEEAEVVSGK